MSYVLYVVGGLCLLVAWNVAVQSPDNVPPDATGFSSLLRSGYAKWWLLAGVVCFAIGVSIDRSVPDPGADTYWIVPALLGRSQSKIAAPTRPTASTFRSGPVC